MNFNLPMLQLLLVLTAVQAQDCDELPSCGYLNEAKHANFANVADLTEYPWIGRLGYVTSHGIAYKCLAVLISAQHLLAPAHCFEVTQLEEEPLQHVLLGDWNPTNSHVQRDCDSLKRCNQVPKLMEISEIIIHPEYDNRTLVNNISILKLAQPVPLSSYISPICLPRNNANHVGQFLPYAGFALNATISHKVKALAQTLGYKQCRRILISYNYAQADQLCHLCATSNQLMPLITGSPLMAVHVEGQEPESYYLVGLLLVMTSSNRPHVFIKVTRYLQWIGANIECS